MADVIFNKNEFLYLLLSWDINFLVIFLPLGVPSS